MSPSILDLSPDTVNEYARKSILPAFKKGRQWRFRRRDIAVVQAPAARRNGGLRAQADAARCARRPATAESTMPST